MDGSYYWKVVPYFTDADQGIVNQTNEYRCVKLNGEQNIFPNEPPATIIAIINYTNKDKFENKKTNIQQLILDNEQNSNVLNEQNNEIIDSDGVIHNEIQNIGQETEIEARRQIDVMTVQASKNGGNEVNEKNRLTQYLLQRYIPVEYITTAHFISAIVYELNSNNLKIGEEIFFENNLLLIKYPLVVKKLLFTASVILTEVLKLHCFIKNNPSQAICEYPDFGKCLVLNTDLTTDLQRFIIAFAANQLVFNKTSKLNIDDNNNIKSTAMLKPKIDQEYIDLSSDIVRKIVKNPEQQKNKYASLTVQEDGNITLITINKREFTWQVLSVFSHNMLFLPKNISITTERTKVKIVIRKEGENGQII